MNIFSPAWRGVRFVADQVCDDIWTCNILPLHIASRTNDHIEIGLGQRNGDSSWVSGGIAMQIDIFDDV